MSRQTLHNAIEKTPVATNFDGLASPNTFNFSLDLEEILTSTCKTAVDLFKVDHSGLMVFDWKQESGHVISEYPPIGTKGQRIQITGVPTEQRLINFQEPISIPDISVDPEFRPVSDRLLRHGLQSMLLVPLISNNRLIGSLGLDMIALHDFTEDEIKDCQAFAQQATAVIELYKQQLQNSAVKSSVLALKAYPNLREMLDSMTRKSVELLGAKDGGISEFNPQRSDLTVIADYKFPDSIGTTITVWEGLAGSVIRKNKDFEAVLYYHDYPDKAQVYEATKRFGAVLIINLRWQDHTMGVLYINAEPGRRFPSELPRPLALLAKTAAIAIANAHLYHEAEIAQKRIEAATALALDPDSKRVLRDIANEVLAAADASWVRLIIFEDNGQRHNFLAVRGKKLVDVEDRSRPNGLTMRVLKSGKPFLIPDVRESQEDLNKVMIEEGCRAALCLPLEFKRGVVWIHYTEPRIFSKSDLQPLQDYLKQASIAYDNTRQMEALEPLREVTESLATGTNSQDVMQRIVDTARQLFRAHAAILFPYPDADSEATLQVREAVTAGVEETLRDQVIDWQLPIGDVTQLVMREGWLPVPDIRDTTQRLPEISRRILERLGAKSFEGLGLLVSGEKLAVLYLVHRQERTFSEAETRRARTFTTHAARALKKAKLLDQAAKRHIATMRAAELNAAAAILDLESTLNEIVVKTKEALQCDAVTLFVYNEETNHLLPLTTMIGVWEPKEADHCEDASHDSVVYQMLKRDEPYYVARVANDSLFREQRFPRREEIESVCAIPLRLNEHRVGVMFINYRKFHPVSAAVLEPINPLIDQAAALILTHLRYIGQIELLGLSKQLLGARNLQESLKFAVKVAAATLVADFIAIVLPDEHGRFRIDESFGWTEEDRRNYEAYKGKEYQTEYTIEMGQPVIVPDYAKERRFKVHPIVSAKDIKCGMSVPMMSGNEPIGAILAHFLGPRPLIEAQTRSLSLLANLTAIAVQHHRAVQSKIASLSAVIFAADEISKIRMGTEHKQVLDTIVEQAVECIPQSFLGTIQTYDKERNTVRLESVYPGEPKGTIQKGTERRLDRSEHSAVGITGRAVITGQPQLVPDVKIDPDYFPYGVGTQSELAVPLLDERDKVLGVLNVESRTLGAFNEDDKQALCALAKLVVATIQNAEQYRLLEMTQRQAVSSTLLAWFGMASSVWGHSVTGNALTIEANVDRLRRKLKAYTLEPGAQKLIDDKLEVIDEMAAQIQEKPITALLHSAEGLSDIDIHPLIYERLEQRWRQPPYDAAHYEVNFAPGVLRVRCHPEWLKRMLDILVHNALDAMSEMGSSRVSISTTTVDGGQIEIAIADHGRGIPMDVREKLFKQRIEQSAGSKGLGTGLLMAQVIAQAYRGAVAVARTDETGTTMSVRLPKVPEN